MKNITTLLYEVFATAEECRAAIRIVPIEEKGE